MVILISVLGLLICLLLWSLYGPIEVYINTWEERAFMNIVGILRFSLYFKEDRFKIRVLGVEFQSRSKTAAEHRKKETFFFPKHLEHAIIPIIETFKLKKLVVKLDTHSRLFNAVLVPVFTLVSSGSTAELSINSHGEIGTELLAQTRASRLLPIFLRYRKIPNKEAFEVKL